MPAARAILLLYAAVLLSVPPANLLAQGGGTDWPVHGADPGGTKYLAKASIVAMGHGIAWYPCSSMREGSAQASTNRQQSRRWGTLVRGELLLHIGAMVDEVLGPQLVG